MQTSIEPPPMTALTFFLEHLDSPTGRLSIATDEAGRLRVVDWEDHEPRTMRILRRHYGDAPRMVDAPRPSKARNALEAYFAGDLTALIGVPTATNGSEFQRKVWAELCRIPAGQTISYGTLAVRINQPKAVRAVGLANGANPIAIVVPCHRVIGANSALVGFGGGLDRKRWLLAHERKLLNKNSPAPDSLL